MRFILGVLLGYYMRGKKRLLIITLTVYVVLIIMCSVVLPAIALSILGLSVMRERASRPPQTSVPVIVGVSYETGQIKLRDANLKIRVLAKRHDPQFEPGIIIAQTPQGGERVDCGTVIGVTLSAEDPWKKPASVITRTQAHSTTR
jgi:beta-lactam-binding protein with PASTA domain